MYSLKILNNGRLHRNIKIEARKPAKNAAAPEGYAVPEIVQFISSASRVCKWYTF